ncbi:MAG: triple tyrosine motif-containing protein [Clostridium sp.]
MENGQIIFERVKNNDNLEQIKIKTLIEAAQYKFMVGNNGIWTTLKDFSEEDVVLWTPDKLGKYMVMVQAKEESSQKPFDFLAREEIVVGEQTKEKLIKDINLEKTEMRVGEKVRISVEASISPVLFRFWQKTNGGWEPIRDYTTENELVYTANEGGEKEILIECKTPESTENFDEFTTVRFKVNDPTKIEITDFKCLTEELLVNEELVFKVDTTHDEGRPLLYKFFKINKDGKSTCIQDFSSRRIISYQEKEAGEYKLLCLVKDILTNKEYDDRALIIYKVKAYNEVVIKKLSTNMKAPQVTGTEIIIKGDVVGGRELLYKFKIDGPIGEDSGYKRGNEFVWQPKHEGTYRITLYAKDISFNGEYEAKETFDFHIEKKGEKPVRINDVILDGKKTMVVGQTANIKIVADGGTSLTYSFLIYKNNKEMERVDYSKTNWVNFTPDEKGEYEIEMRVKDKFSNKEYDANTFMYLKAKEYLPGEIDCILVSNTNNYLVGDTIELEIITQNTKSVLIKYVTKINGHIVEETEFIKNKKLKIKPKCAGKYVFEFYAKNVKCTEEFDSKKEIIINVAEAPPVTGTKLSLSKDSVKVSEEITVSVNSTGGKDVCYEFYLMEKGNWVKAQSYSKKHYYTFMPFATGEYRILVLAKSFYKKVNYEDYDEISFTVKK